MIDYARILDHLYIGTHPEGPEDIKELKARCRVTAILNLQTERDFRQRDLDWPRMEALYKKAGISVYRVPMRDFDYDHQEEQLPEAVKTLSTLLASGHTVYLHCNAGLSRSPLVAMAYLYWCLHFSLEEAVNYVKERRPCFPEEELLQKARKAAPPC
jgi:protein-tyrosine phosphatase